MNTTMQKIDLSIKNSIPPVDGGAASNLVEANKRLLLMKMKQEKIASIEEAGAKMISDIQKWMDEEIAPLQKSIEFFSDGAKKYMEAELKGSTRKSLKLPAGVIKEAPTKTEFFLSDGSKPSARNTAWASASGLGSFVKTETKESLDWAALKKALSVNDDGSCSLNGAVINGLTAAKSGGEVVIKLND